MNFKNLDTEISSLAMREWKIFFQDTDRLMKWNSSIDTNRDPFASAMLGELPPGRFWIGKHVANTDWIVDDKEYPGPPNWTPGKNDITRIVKMRCPSSALAMLPGRCGEHKVFIGSEFGRMNEAEFMDLVKSLKSGWRETGSILVIVENGNATICEGNHRMHAAMMAGIDLLVEIRWLGEN